MIKNKFYITTPVYYANAAPHIGSAYTTIAADVLARWHRMGGEEVFFLAGTDEHGGKIAEQALLEGKSPQEFVDNISAQFQFAWDALNISNNNFLRTTDTEHIKAVEEVLRILYDKGYFYKGAYKGFYCQDCEQFYTKTELEDGRCPYHQKELKIISEPCYFFKLSQFQDKLKDLIEKDKFEIRPLERKNEILGFLGSQKLKDVAISRTKIKWGIPLPFDKEHTCYVWVDAFLNYLTGLGVATFSSRSSDVNRALKSATPNSKFWPPDVQLMAKDILRVHATIWPSLLLALDLPLPRKLFVHGFFTTNGRKMSKSLGNILDPVEISRQFGVDGLRYFLLAEIPFGKDGDVSIKRLKERYNSDLANGLGNLVSRVLTMASNDGVATFRSRSTSENRRLKSATPGEIANFSSQSWGDYEKAMREIQFHKALEACWKFIRACDSYIEQEKPWKLMKNQKPKTKNQKLDEIIYNLLESLRQIAWMILPFMPDTAKKIFDQLGGIWESENDKPLVEAKEWGGLKGDVRVEKGETLFPRL